VNHLVTAYELQSALEGWTLLASSSADRKTLWVGVGRERFKIAREGKTIEVDDLPSAVEMYNYGWE